MIPIEFEMVIFRENKTYVSYSPDLDVSSCGDTVEEARKNLKTAVRLFLEEAEKLGTLNDILVEAGFKVDASGKWNPPKMVSVESVELA